MKLRNKKTGEIGYPYFQNWKEITCVIVDENAIQIAEYTSLAKLNEEWEDYEEPKEYWYLENNGEVVKTSYEGNLYEEKMQQIGNYFLSRKEAKKAVEKLKAWKRLRDKGFEFRGYEIIDGTIRFMILPKGDYREKVYDDLSLLFGGEE